MNDIYWHTWRYHTDVVLSLSSFFPHSAAFKYNCLATGKKVCMWFVPLTWITQKTCRYSEYHLSCSYWWLSSAIWTNLDKLFRFASSLSIRRWINVVLVFSIYENTEAICHISERPQSTWTNGCQKNLWAEKKNIWKVDKGRKLFPFCFIIHRIAKCILGQGSFARRTHERDAHTTSTYFSIFVGSFLLMI